MTRPLGEMEESDTKGSGSRHSAGLPGMLFAGMGWLDPEPPVEFSYLDKASSSLQLWGGSFACLHFA